MNFTLEPEKPNQLLFLAIGEFFVKFSHLISITEHLTASLISKGGGEDEYKRARIAVSNLTAQPLSNAFFAVLKEFETQNWTSKDQEILKRVRAEMDLLIKQRNRFAHDTWHLGHPNLPRPDSSSWHRIRTVGTQTTGLLVEYKTVTVEQINNLIDQVKRIDANIRQLSLAGIAGDTYRPELHLHITTNGSGDKYVTCIQASASG